MRWRSAAPVAVSEGMSSTLGTGACARPSHSSGRSVRRSRTVGRCSTRGGCACGAAPCDARRSTRSSRRSARIPRSQPCPHPPRALAENSNHSGRKGVVASMPRRARRLHRSRAARFHLRPDERDPRSRSPGDRRDGARAGRPPRPPPPLSVPLHVLSRHQSLSLRPPAPLDARKCGTCPFCHLVTLSSSDRRSPLSAVRPRTHFSQKDRVPWSRTFDPT